MKTLIIDDNHSFIDLLKNALQPFRMQIDSYYKFSEARNVLFKNGSYFNQTVANEILKHHENVVKSTNLTQPPAPVLETPLINQNGYGLIFLEYDAEPSMKGHHFIQDVLKNQKNWSEKNFILMSSDPGRIESIAKKLNVAFVEKPLKKDQLLKLVHESVQFMTQKENELNQLIEKYGITFNLSEKQNTTRKKISPSPKKKTKKKVSARSLQKGAASR